jgi:uncharacterized phage protein gp47/JayE
MPYDRDTITQLRQKARADMVSAVTNGKQLPRFSILGVMADDAAGLANEQLGYLDWISKMAVPYTAEDEFLIAWAALKNVFLDPATQAICPSVQWLGINGTPLPAGTLVTRSDGVEYTTTADGIWSGSTVTAPIQAVADPTGLTGAFGNAPSGTVLTLAASIPGIQAAGATTAAITGGADLETLDSLRTRMLQKYQAPPQGGAIADYLEWAQAVPGVTRAWVMPQGLGNATVIVYVMFDETEAGNGGFPVGSNGVATNEPRGTTATGDQLAVANAIFPLQPIGPIVSVRSPANQALNVTTTGLSGLSTAAQAAVTAAIAAAIVRTAAVAGTYNADGTPNTGTIDVDDLEAAILATAGGVPFLVTSPSGNVTPAAGALCTPGTVTFST